ncbi:MAG: caspase family protein [Ktedonobacteraceae bacterium]|nr:caspase family protein [Ktedonobacteraceae bacterium]
MGNTVEILICSAREDERFLNMLLTALAGPLKPLQQKKLVSLWHQRDTSPGGFIEQEFQSHLQNAKIILLLISSDFMSMDFCDGHDMQRLMRQHKAGEVRVIPILLRETYWETAPFGMLQPLPDNGQAVNSWGNKDRAFLNTAKGVKKIVDEFLSLPPTEPGTRNGGNSMTEDLSRPHTSDQQPSSTNAEQPRTEPNESDVQPAPEPYNGMANYWGVIVGVGEYEDSAYAPLPTCREDAKALARQLTSCGYGSNHIRLLVDGGKDKDPFIRQLMGDNSRLSKPTKGNIIETLETVAKRTKPEDLLLFYHTGHGCQEKQESYLVSYDGRSQALQHTAVPIAIIKDIMHKAPAQKKVIILDACRADVTSNSMRAPQPMPLAFIERVFEQAKGLVILTSCGAEENSYVWEEKRRSVFTYYLLQALQNGNADFNGKDRISANDLYHYIRNGVTRWATLNNRFQDPCINVDGQGDIVVAYYLPEPLISASNTLSPAKYAPVVSAPRVNALSWRELEAITIQGEHYVFEHATVRETPIGDDRATLREARVRHVRTNHLLQLKQAHIVDQTGDAIILQKILKREYQMLAELAENGPLDFPSLFSLLNPEKEPDFTFAYTLVDGTTLAQAFRESNGMRDESSIKHLLQSALPLCETLSVLHKKGWSHRRLSLDSIVLFQEQYFRVLDVGLAARKPAKGEILDQYRLAPEQDKKNSDIEAKPGPATDIYQLGRILYRLLTGRTYSSGALLHFHNKAVSPQLDETIIRAVARQPTERWPDMEAFSTALRQSME